MLSPPSSVPYAPLRLPLRCSPLRRAAYRRPRSGSCVCRRAEEALPSSHTGPLTIPSPLRREVHGRCIPRRFAPSVAFARFCQTRLLFGPPCGGLTCRRGRLHLMLRTGELLDPLKGLCHGASPVGSRLAAAVSYRAAWSLPGPDSHWLVDVILHGITSSRRSTSFLRHPATGHAETGASPLSRFSCGSA